MADIYEKSANKYQSDYAKARAAEISNYQGVSIKPGPQWIKNTNGQNESAYQASYNNMREQSRITSKTTESNVQRDYGVKQQYR